MVDATPSGALFPPEILDEIFHYIGDSKPRTRRPGYTYEPDSDDEDDSDEEYESDGLEAGWVGEGLGKYDRIHPSFPGFDETDFTDLDLREDYGWSDEVLCKHSPHIFFPTYTLRPLVLVCKAWKGVAERRLYGSISIGSDNEDTGANGADHLERLLETLTENPRLAALVQELRFSTMTLSSDESCDQILIMELCPNVTHFTLMGYNGEVLVDYHNALTRFNHLKSLTISKFDLRDYECDGFCSIDQLISFMYGWPELESVFFHRSAASWGLAWKDDGMEAPEEAPEEQDDEEDEGEDVDPNDEWEMKRRELLQQYREERLLQKPIEAALREKLLNPPATACPHLRSVVLRDCTEDHRTGSGGTSRWSLRLFGQTRQRGSNSIDPVGANASVVWTVTISFGLSVGGRTRASQPIRSPTNPARERLPDQCNLVGVVEVSTTFDILRHADRRCRAAEERHPKATPSSTG
ncbi:hypothetical protein BDZ89DRAFT_1032791 [Hymenopellis radicata]|nr:hypothetical protein BDZ89DRAFT_1032791 [Hymenopellis radicata]